MTAEEQTARNIEDIFARGAPGGWINGKFVTPVEMRRNAIVSALRALIDVERADLRTLLARAVNGLTIACRRGCDHCSDDIKSARAIHAELAPLSTKTVGPSPS